MLNNTNNELIDFEIGYKYKIYVGLNDKSKKRQLMCNNKAIKTITHICNEYLDAFTMTSSYGDCNCKLLKCEIENSIIIDTINPNFIKLESLINTLIIKLNQESILVEAEEVKYKFYK